MKLLIYFTFVTALSFGISIDHVTHPCGKDFQLRCTKEPMPHSGNHFGCLSKQYTELSQECQSFIDKEIVTAPCGKEMVELCKGTNRNLSKSLACLQAHSNYVGKECKDKLASLNEGRSKIAQACDKDFMACSPKLNAAEGAECRKELYDSHKVSKVCYEVMTPFMERMKARTQGR